MAAPFIIIDGSSYLYRAFHALPPLSNAQGQPTGAIYGVINMIQRLLQDYSPTQLAVVFDAKGKTFRDQLFAEYKAHRPPMPQDLQVQIEPLHQVIRALGLPLLIIEGVEADDVIATLVRQAEKKGLSVLISTGDKDMAQLVTEQVHLINTMTNTRLDPKGVLEKFGVPPERIVDYLALVGDSSDNVPGIPGCGPKTAVKWLQHYGSLENLLEHVDEIEGKVGQNLRDNLPLLSLSRQLVTVHTEVPLPLSLDDLFPQPPDSEQVRKLYTTLGFKSALQELEGRKGTVAPSPSRVEDYSIITDKPTLEAWLAHIREKKICSFDTETTSLEYMQAEIVGVSFALAPHKAAYVPCGHDYEGAPAQLSRHEVLTALKPILEDPQIIKICQHGKYDMNVLNRYDIYLRGVQFDTMLESYVINSTATRHDLSSLASHYLHRNSIAFKDLAGTGKNQRTFNQIPLDQAAQYAAEDADLTWQLHEHLWPLLKACPETLAVYEKIEAPLIPVLSAMECKGVLIDTKKLATLSQQFGEHMQRLQEKIFESAGNVFNIESPKQLQAILFEQLKLPILKKTPKGQPSTAEPVLEALAADYELPSLIMQYRSYAKLKSTYTDKLPQLMNIRTGRVHTSYHQANTSTGRLASSDPNLQNIPIRDAQGRAIRQAFIAAPGYQLISADYSQIELRIMAHFSNDPGLIRAFAQGQDIHRATAAEVFNVSLDEVTPEQRRKAKAINFGLIYGMSAFGLAKQLNEPRNLAQQYIDTYFARYPGVHRYMEEARIKAREQGYIETLFGRRLYLPDIQARNKILQQAAERAAINAPMQGSAADLIKIAMIRVHHALKKAGLKAQLIMQVHDELIIEAAEADLDKARLLLIEAMRQAADLRVSLEVGVGTALNWDAAH